jgi:hypothetical protein
MFYRVQPAIDDSQISCPLTGDVFITFNVLICDI